MEVPPNKAETDAAVDDANPALSLLPLAVFLADEVVVGVTISSRIGMPSSSTSSSSSEWMVPMESPSLRMCSSKFNKLDSNELVTAFVLLLRVAFVWLLLLVVVVAGAVMELFLIADEAAAGGAGAIGLLKPLTLLLFALDDAVVLDALLAALYLLKASLVWNKDSAVSASRCASVKGVVDGIEAAGADDPPARNCAR